MAPTQTRTDTPRRVFVSAGSHTPHYQLRRYITEHCEDWRGRCHDLLNSLIIGSLGDICINCLTLKKVNDTKLCARVQTMPGAMFLLSDVISYSSNISQSFVVLVISVTGVAVMQQLKQQSPLDKGDPNNTDAPCFSKLNGNTELSFFILYVFTSDICQFPDPASELQLSCFSCTGE